MTAPKPLAPWAPGLLIRARIHHSVRQGGVAVTWDRASQTWTVDGVSGLGWDEAIRAVGGER